MDAGAAAALNLRPVPICGVHPHLTECKRLQEVGLSTAVLSDEPVPASDCQLNGAILHTEGHASRL